MQRNKQTLRWLCGYEAEEQHRCSGTNKPYDGCVVIKQKNSTDAAEQTNFTMVVWL
jgi:hypothetical protein